MTPKEPLNTRPRALNDSDESTLPDFPTSLDRDIAARLQLAREKQRLSRDEIAAQIGIAVDVYSQLELARRRIDAWHLSKLAMALDLPISWFFEPSQGVERGAPNGRGALPGTRRPVPSDSDARIRDLRRRLVEVRTKRHRD